MTEQGLTAEGLKNLIESRVFEANVPIAKRVRRRLALSFASSIDPIVRAIARLAEASNDAVIDIKDYKAVAGNDLTFFKYIVFNAEILECCDRQPADNDIFGLNGTLGLRAIILEMRSSNGELKVEMSLVLKPWGTGLNPPTRGEFVIATFETTGDSRATVISPHIRKDKNLEPFTDIDAYLKDLLGMQQLDNNVECTSFDRTVGQALGFPGADDYLATMLYCLPDYIDALTQEVDSPHQH